MFDFLAPARLALETARIGLDAQMVVGLRVAGKMGLWRMEPDELGRMVAEKPAAVREAVEAFFEAAQRGEAPHRALSASLVPIGERAASNVKRLAGQAA